MKHILKRSLFQRMFFVFSLIIWCVLLLGETLENGKAITSIGISYSYLFWIVTGILILHIVFNNYITWIFCFVTFNLLFLTHSLKLIEDYKIFHGSDGEYMNGFSSYLISAAILFAIILIDVLLWKLNPKRIRIV